MLGNGSPFHEALYVLFFSTSEGHSKFGDLWLLILQIVVGLCELRTSVEPAMDIFIAYDFMAKQLNTV